MPEKEKNTMPLFVGNRSIPGIFLRDSRLLCPGQRGGDMGPGAAPQKNPGRNAPVGLDDEPAPCTRWDLLGDALCPRPFRLRRLGGAPGYAAGGVAKSSLRN